MQKELIVLNFTARLPGPYGVALLSDLGIKCLSFEHSNHPDPFSLSVAGQLFNDWHQQMQQELHHYSDSIPATIISGLKNKKVIALIPPFLLDFVKKELKDIDQLGLLILCAHPDNLPMHDLNAFAHTKFFDWQMQLSPHLPPLPMTGLWFGEEIAQQTLLLAMELEQQPKIERKLNLFDATKKREKLLTSQSPAPHLHQGSVACYRVYSHPEGHIAVAAVEEKFWKKLMNILDLTIERNSSHQSDFQKIEEKFAKLSFQQLQKYSPDQFCVTLRPF